MSELVGTTKDYAWGSESYLQELLGYQNHAGPLAEVWYGTHHAGPTRTRAGEPLLSLAGRPLGYLVKWLAAAQPLSIQVHPDSAAAQAGFAAEHAAGVALDSPQRRYRDPNPKPEVLVATTATVALAGYRRLSDAAAYARALDVPELETACRIASRHGWRAATEQLLTRTPAAAVGVLAGAAARLACDSGRWAADARVLRRIAEKWPADPGTALAAVLRVVRLAPGDALSLPTGVPHAYVDGAGVEVMGCSDNVLRAGCTPKLVDIPELLRVLVDADAVVTRKVAGRAVWQHYPVPGDRFTLARLAVGDGACSLSRAPALLVVTAGAVRFAGGAAASTLRAGTVAWLEHPGTFTGPGEVLVVTEPRTSSGPLSGPLVYATAPSLGA